MTESNVGSLLFYDNRIDDAARHYRRALALNPDDYRIHGNLGDCLRHTAGAADSARAHYALAIREGERALEVNPRDATALASLAEYNVHLARRVEAERRMAQALRVAETIPRSPAPCSYEQMGERTAALDHLRRAVESGHSLVEVAGTGPRGAAEGSASRALLAGRG